MDDRAGLDRPPDQRARRIQLSAAPASDRWREVKEILADALERDDETRKALLEDVRARDSGLAREVESLLGWYQAPSAAETPPGGSRFRLQPGDALGPYVIEERLDSGGMGVVYRARDTRLNRAVAVKVLDGNMAGGLETLRRFEREARTVASLSHPNILSIFDYGTQGAVAYAVTELLVGSNLRGVLRGGPLPLAKAVGLAGQIAEGLAAAHANGIVHRDLKPENVFLCSDGLAKILDFGLAKRTWPLAPSGSGDASLETRAGLLLGTVGYMAPEQVRGEAVDARADVFAFGVLLHEMLTGRRPFDRDTPAETLAAVLRDEVPASDVSVVPLPLAGLLRRSMAKDREARYASAAELLPVIRSIAAHPVDDGRRTLARRTALAAVVAGGLAIVRSAGTRSETKLRTPDRVISVGKTPYSITAGGAWIWTANKDGNSVTRIDAATGTVTGTFPAGEMASVVVWDGEVIWVANHKWLTGEYSTLMKLDPNDGRILDTFRLPGQPIHLMVEGPHIWVTETWPTYMVRKLRRADGKEMGAYTAGGIPRQAVTDGESVWVTNGAIGSVTRIRASDGKIMVARAIEGAPNFVCRAGGHIWVANNHTESEKETIFKLIPDNLKVVEQFSTPFSWTGTVTERWFFTAAPGRVSQRRVKDGSEAGRWVVGREPLSIIHDGTNLWVADFTESSVTMISARSLEDADRPAKRA